ncbi:MAG: hypothetical protein RIG77_18460 [Cyclobacteriaceae bacterium]
MGQKLTYLYACYWGIVIKSDVQLKLRKKLEYIILIPLVIISQLKNPATYKNPSSIVIQEETIKNGSMTDSTKVEDIEQYKNQLFKELSFFGAGLGYKKLIHKNFSIGIKGGVGFQTNIWLKKPDDSNLSNLFFEPYHYGAFLNYSKSGKWQYEIGLRRTAYYYDDKRVNGTTSMNLSVFRKIKKFHLGLNMTLGKNEDKESLAYLSLLTFRVPLKDW